MSVFKKAERKRVFFKMAITGPSGAGKTYSALKIAKGLGGKIALIDTEAGSAALYADSKDMPSFDTIELSAPYTTARYIDLIHIAGEEGYDVLIIDSISHQWQGEGGIMDRKEKEQLAKPAANGFTLFAKYTPEHEKFKQAILHAKIHIIATMRSKTDYVMEQNERGKMAPKKVGLAPIQREGFDYEFSTVFDLSAEEHYARVSKDRTGLFDGKHFLPDEKTGTEIMDWLSSGKETVWSFGEKQRSDLMELMKSFSAGKEAVTNWIAKNKNVNDCNEVEYGDLMRYMEIQKGISTAPGSFDEKQTEKGNLIV